MTPAGKVAKAQVTIGDLICFDTEVMHECGDHLVLTLCFFHFGIELTLSPPRILIESAYL